MVESEVEDNISPTPGEGTLLLRNIKVLGTFNENLEEIKNGAVFIRKNVIEWVGETASLPPDRSTADLVIDMSCHVVIPGAPIIVEGSSFKIISCEYPLYNCVLRSAVTDS